jgi:hypothetical protein
MDAPPFLLPLRISAGPHSLSSEKCQKIVQALRGFPRQRGAAAEVHLCDIPLVQQVKSACAVDYGNGVIRVIFCDSVDLAPILQEDRDRVETGGNAGAAMENTVPEIADREIRPGVRQIGSEQAAVPANGMAFSASRFPEKEFASGGRITCQDRLRRRGAEIAHKGRELPGLIVRKLRGRHTGARDALANGVEQFLIVHLLQVAIAGEGGTAAAFGIGAMTSRAIASEALRARLDCGLLSGERVLLIVGVAHVLRWQSENNQQQNKRGSID